MEKLKPCPFCGTTPKIDENEIGYFSGISYSIHHVCMKSDIDIEIGIYATIKKIINEWNKKV
jgi:hypothetical protein